MYSVWRIKSQARIRARAYGDLRIHVVAARQIT